MGGGSSNQAGGPPPIPLVNAENVAFGGTVPFSNVGQAPQGAFAGIQNLNTNPGAQYGGINAIAGNGAIQSNNLLSNLTGASSAGNSVISNMFNPQSGYYQQLFNQNQQQANAENAMAGVATTPYGASLTNQADLNFNNQWQSFLNSQQSTAANTASTLFGSAANTLGAGLGGDATALGIGQSIDSQNYNAQQGQIQDYLNYILGNASNASSYFGAANNTFGEAVNQAGITSGAALNANNQLGGELAGLGSLAGSLGKLGISAGFI